MSQEDKHIIKINDRTYQISMMPPKLSQKLLIQLSKMIGPSLGPVLDKFVGKTTKQILNTEINSDFISKTMSSLFQDLDSDVLENLMDRFSEYTLVDGKKLDQCFSIVFMGKIDEMYRWFVFCMQVQWGKSLSVLWNWIVSQGAQKLNP